MYSFYNPKSTFLYQKGGFSPTVLSQYQRTLQNQGPFIMNIQNGGGDSNWMLRSIEEQKGSSAYESISEEKCRKEVTKQLQPALDSISASVEKANSTNLWSKKGDLFSTE